MIPLAVFGSAFIGIILLVFANRKSHYNPYILVMHCNDFRAEKNAGAYLKEHTGKCVLKSKMVQKGMIELNLEVRLKDENTDFINKLSELQGVFDVTMVSYNGDYMG